MAPMMARRPPAGCRSHRNETLRSCKTYSAETARLLWFFQQIVEGASEQAGTRKGEAFVADEFDLRDLSLDRRSFLRRGAAGGLGVALLGTGGMSAILAACGSSSKPAATGSSTSLAGPKDLGELTFQLSWIKNVEFAGEYIADTNGYYKDAGFSKVTLPVETFFTFWTLIV